MTGKKQRAMERLPIRWPFAMLRANRAKTRAEKRYVRDEQLPAVEQPAPPRAQSTEGILQQRFAQGGRLFGIPKRRQVCRLAKSSDTYLPPAMAQTA